jgi:DNA-binding CsgD family transcriptional regulator
MIEIGFRMPEEVFQRAMRVMKDEFKLSNKQMELLRLISHGESNSYMADILETSRQSVDTRTWKLRMKLKVPAGGHQKDRIINFMWSYAWNEREQISARRSTIKNIKQRD